ncbi:hypothetical protein RJ640_028113, partial [Escallonia rubra]
PLYKRVPLKTEVLKAATAIPNQKRISKQRVYIYLNDDTYTGTYMVMMEKYQQYERVFRHFDENGDGKISPPELQRCVGAIPGFGAERQLSLEEAEAAVVLMDSDGDGLLCLDDFVRLVDGAGEEEKAKDLKEAFKLYAGDERGHCITAKSLKQMLSKIGESKSTEDCKRMISRFDLNGDGVLQFDEFMVMMAL